MDDRAVTGADARALNWRFVVPDEPAGLLLLSVDGELVHGAIAPERRPSALADALRAGPYPAVVAPDLSAWAAVGDGDPRALLERLAASVAPGGWIYAGFANAAYPGRRAGALRPGAVRRVIRAAGFLDLEVYLAFPSVSCPAYLVSAAGAAPLDYFLDRLSFPPPPEHDPGRGRGSRTRAALMLRAARLAPHRARVAFAPGLAIVGRRAA